MSKFAKRMYRLAAVLTLLSAASLANAYPTSYYTTRSAMSEGTWVRVSVDQCGIYQLTYEQLRALGFNNPEQVTVYGYGANTLTDNTFSPGLPDDLQPTATYHTSDGRIIFYAEAQVATRLVNGKTIAIKRNMYDVTGSYFLSDVAGKVDITPAEFTPSNKVHTSQYDVQLIENDVQNPGFGGAIFHDRILECGEGEDFEYHIRDFDNSKSESGYFRYNFAARSSIRVGMEMVLPTNVTIHNSANMTANPVYKNNKLFNTNYGYAEFRRDNVNSLQDATLKFTLRRPADSKSAEYMAVDYAYVIYPRTSRLRRQGQLMMYVLDARSGDNFRIGDASEHTQVWNVDNPAAIFPYQTNYDDDAKTVTCTFSRNYSEGENGTGRIIAFDPEAEFPQPAIKGYVPNQDIHGSETPELLIITTTSLLPYAEELAEAHRTLQGIKVNVFTQEQVYNEFSSGSRAAMAYRRLAKMYYDRDPQTFRHLLLYGAATWDNRNSFDRGRDLLIAYEAELERWASDSGTNFSADTYFAMLSDNYDPTTIHYALMDINVGRIAADTEAKAMQYNNKAIAYMTNPPSLRSILTGVAISDVGNRLSHITQSEEAVAAITGSNPAMTMYRAHAVIYPYENFSAVKLRSVVTDALTQGSGYFTYSGHGNHETFGSGTLWSKLHAEKTAYTNFPVGMLATCDAYSFDRMDNGIGEAMIFSRNGGLIAMVAACRSVYLEYNQNINRPFAEGYGRARRGTTVGDVFRYAYNRSKHREVTTDESAMANSLCYNLAGDPAIPIYAPGAAAVITSVDGHELSADTPDGSVVVAPLAPVRVKGYVAGANGQPDASFNGQVEIVVFEAPLTRTTKNTDDDAPNFDVQFDETILAQFTATVAEGEFDADITMPIAARPGAVNRLVVYAEDDDDVQNRASGYTYAVSVSADPDESNLDFSAPSILDMTIDVPATADGLVRSSDVTLLATIDPSASGLNLSKGMISSGVRLVQDGTMSFPRVSSSITISPDGLAHLSQPITGLTEGVHRLTLTVQNNVGASDNCTISFTVAPAAAPAALTVAERPARTVATFDLDCPASDVTDTRLVIRDSEGNTVLSVADASFPYAWDLRDSAGAEVPDGRYRAHVVIRTEASGDVSSPVAEVVVLR